jgi:hypothetical protein
MATRGDMGERYAVDRYRAIEHPAPLFRELVRLGLLRGDGRYVKLTEQGRKYAAGWAARRLTNV